MQRFIEAQKKDFEKAYKELSEGRKETHWMWYIFPQDISLGKSPIALYYGLNGVSEAKKFYSNKYLRNNLLKITQLVLDYEGYIEFPHPDDLKLLSCMEIFYKATGNDLFRKVIEKYERRKN